MIGMIPTFPSLIGVLLGQHPMPLPGPDRREWKIPSHILSLRSQKKMSDRRQLGQQPWGTAWAAPARAMSTTTSASEPIARQPTTSLTSLHLVPAEWSWIPIPSKPIFLSSSRFAARKDFNGHTWVLIDAGESGRRGGGRWRQSPVVMAAARDEPPVEVVLAAAESPVAPPAARLEASRRVVRFLYPVRIGGPLCGSTRARGAAWPSGLTAWPALFASVLSTISISSALLFPSEASSLAAVGSILSGSRIYGLQGMYAPSLLFFPAASHAYKSA